MRALDAPDESERRRLLAGGAAERPMSAPSSGPRPAPDRAPTAALLVLTVASGLSAGGAAYFSEAWRTAYGAGAFLGLMGGAVSALLSFVGLCLALTAPRGQRLGWIAVLLGVVLAATALGAYLGRAT